MGCYPLGKIISRALGRHKSKENRRRRSLDKMTAMSPPPAYCHATRSTVKTVTFSNNNPVFIIPPDQPTPSTSPPKQRPEPPISSGSAPTKTTAATEHKKEKKSGHSATSKAESVHDGTPYSSSQHGPEPAVYSRPGMSYTMTPLPRWEEEDRRRREYFGGEYCYYPTPIRDGIYSFATDANRLTSMFSDENPNACNIV